MPRKAPALEAQPPSAPTEVELLAATPAPQTIAAPAALMGFLERYQANIAPLETFTVVDNDSYVQAGTGFTSVDAFIKEIEALFEPSKKAAHQAHKNITTLEGMFVNPAARVKANLAQQQLTWRRKLDNDRRAEEQRLQRIEQQRLDQEAKDRREAAEAERLRLAALAEAEALPWEDAAPPEPPPAPIPPPEPIRAPVVRLPSSIPFVPGIQPRKKPWAGKIIDFKAAFLEAARRAEAGSDAMMLDLFEARTVRINQLAREHEGALAEIYPGCAAYQDETLARA